MSHDHAHGHEHHQHHHDHDHDHDLSWKGLVGMGASAGLIPCPSALVVLLWFLCVLSILGVVCFFCWLLIGVSRFP